MLQCRENYGEYSHNDRCYSGLYNSLERLIETTEEFIKFINNMLPKLNMYSIFNEKIHKEVDRNFDIKEYAKRHSIDDLKNILNTYPSEDFQVLRMNLNILGLDLTFLGTGNLITMPFEFIDKSKDKSILITWLEVNYPTILESYERAVQAYSIGDSVGTMSHCRSVLTGIFSYKKRDDTSWLTGLQEACTDDKHLKDIISPKKIRTLQYIKKDDLSEDEYKEVKIDNKYNYPRFRTIDQIYSYLCDLGPHVTEGPNLIGDDIPISEKVNSEITNANDALMGLRMTEDILIWLYQKEQNA